MILVLELTLLNLKARTELGLGPTNHFGTLAKEAKPSQQKEINLLNARKTDSVDLINLRNLPTWKRDVSP